MARMSFKGPLTIRGREFRGLRGFAGKPFHPPLTDLPIGAYIIGPALDVLSFLFSSQSWAHRVYDAAGYIILAGAAVSLLTALTGFADWLATRAGSQIRRVANAHAWTMIFMTVLVLVDLALRYLGPDRKHTDLPLAAIGVVIMLLATIGGTIGGSLVYDYGFSVEGTGGPRPKRAAAPADPAKTQR